MKNLKTKKLGPLGILIGGHPSYGKVLHGENTRILDLNSKTSKNMQERMKDLKQDVQEVGEKSDIKRKKQISILDMRGKNTKGI